MAAPKRLADLSLGTNYQIPNNLLNAAFGELNLTRHEDHISALVTILMEPVKEGSQTGVAIDGSDSMQGAFGRVWGYTDKFDQTVLERLIREGKGEMVESDGQGFFQAKQAGFEELQRLGFIVQSSNEIEPIAQEVVPYLAEKIDADGGTTAIYWACGKAGDALEVLGDLRADEARVAAFAGPAAWGQKTRLLPALKYFVERFADAEWGFYVFITDGRLDDLENVKDYTADLARRIHAGAAKPVKCVLIGVGQAVDEQQMIELDDLPDQMDLPVDIWDHKVAATTRGLRDIFAEVVDEHAFVAPTGRVLTDSGEVITDYEGGLPGIIKFELPLTVQGFVVEAGQERFEQKFT